MSASPLVPPGHLHHRPVFECGIGFSNGRQGRDFRPYIPGQETGEAALAARRVAGLRLSRVKCAGILRRTRVVLADGRGVERAA